MSNQLCWRLARYISPHWEVLAFALASMISMAVTAPLLAALVRPMLDGAIAGKDRESMQLILMGIIALFAVRGVAGYAGTYAINWVGSKLTADLRVEIFDKLLRLPGQYYATHSAGSLIFTIISSTDQVARTFVAVVTVVVKDSFTVLCLLGWVFYLNWQLSMVALSMAALVLLIMRLLAARLRKMEPKIARSLEGMAPVLKESIANYVAVKLYGGLHYENRRAREQAGEMHRLLMKRIAVAALGVPLAQMTFAIALAAITYYAAQQAFADEITVGSFASGAAALAMMGSPMRRLARVRGSIQPGLTAGHSIFSLLDEQPEPVSETVAIERVRGELRFEHVSFQDLPKQRGETGAEQAVGACSALRDVSLTVHPGEMVALVSFQENSITTLANLVPLFFHPTGGKIFLDGQDLESISLASLRANIAVVSVDTALSNDTIAANIAYGEMGQATEARIMAAAYAAHVSEFTRELPEGMQTQVGIQGTSGVKLSAGQRFRIAAARAFLKNPPILILDETGKALDAESVPHVEAALEAVTRERTTLVVAHRLSTVEKANRVVLLHNGRIVAIGRHSELLAREKTYARLARTFI